MTSEISKLKTLYQELDRQQAAGEDVVAELKKEINNLELAYLKEQVLPQVAQFMASKVRDLRCGIDSSFQFDGEQSINYSFCTSGSMLFVKDSFDVNSVSGISEITPPQTKVVTPPVLQPETETAPTQRSIRLVDYSEKADAHYGGTNLISTPVPLQKSKNDILPAFRLVRKRLSEGWSYDQIIDECEQLEASGQKEYRSKQGRPITKAILSHWAKELGYDVRPGGKAKDKIDKWKDTSEGYQWFKAQILAGIAPEAIIEEFNKRHASYPKSYSTPLGASMTVSTYNRWRKEIVTVHDNARVSKPISPIGAPSTRIQAKISSSPTNTTMDGFYRQRGMFRVLEWARLQSWWDLWMKNFKSSSEVPINEYLDDLKSPVNLISSAFHWSLTAEGRNYWTAAEEDLKNHIKFDIRAVLYTIKRQVTVDTPYTITKELFYQLIGYGQDVFEDTISLDRLCDEIGLCLSEITGSIFEFNMKRIC